jgi:hypothetical protein
MTTKRAKADRRVPCHVIGPLLAQRIIEFSSKMDRNLEKVIEELEVVKCT